MNARTRIDCALDKLAGDIGQAISSGLSGVGNVLGSTGQQVGSAIGAPIGKAIGEFKGGGGIGSTIGGMIGSSKGATTGGNIGGTLGSLAGQALNAGSRLVGGSASPMSKLPVATPSFAPFTGAQQ